MEENDQLRIDMADQMQCGLAGHPNGCNHALQDYQIQVMLLEQENKKRFLRARQERDRTDEPGLKFGIDTDPFSASNPAWEVNQMSGGSATVPSESERQQYLHKLRLLEQQNKEGRASKTRQYKRA
jgi:hypothetical protein